MPPRISIEAPHHVRRSVLLWRRGVRRHATIALDVRCRFDGPLGNGRLDRSAWADHAALGATVPYRNRCNVLAPGAGSPTAPLYVRVLRDGHLVQTFEDRGEPAQLPMVVAKIEDGDGFALLPPNAPPTFNASPRAQQLVTVTGREVFLLEGGSLGRGLVRFALPVWTVEARLAPKGLPIPLELDTIVIDVAGRSAVMTFRGSFSVLAAGTHTVHVLAEDSPAVSNLTPPAPTWRPQTPTQRSGLAHAPTLIDAGAPFRITRPHDSTTEPLSRRATPFGGEQLPRPREPGEETLESA